MGNRFYAGMSDYIEKMNELDDAVLAAGSSTSPVFQNLQVANSAAVGSSSQDGTLLINGTVARGATALIQNNGNAIIGFGNKSALMGGNYSPVPFLYGSADIECNVGLTLNRTLAIQNVAGAVQLKNDAAYMTFFNSAGSQYMGFLQGLSGVAFDIIAGAGHQLRLGAGGAIQMRIDTSGNFSPVVDGAKYCGLPEYRWAGLYAATGTVQTSDGRKKTPITTMTRAMRAAAREMLRLIGTYQWLDSVNAKGVENARLHVGFTVQQAIEILEKHGIDPFAMAFVCHDKWGAEYENRQINVGEKTVKLRIVQKQKMRVVNRPQEVVEIVDGKPVLVRKVIEVKEPVFEDLPVNHQDGSPVMLEGHVQMLHRVPVMEVVQEPYEAEAEPKYEKVLVREAGDCFAFRYDQLALFILSGLVPDSEPVAA